MTEESAVIQMYANKISIRIMWICVKHFEATYKPDNKAAVARLLEKLMEEISEDSGSPYDAVLELTPEEGWQLDNSLHVTITDVSLGTSEVINEIPLSTLSNHTPLMAQLLRDLDVATQIADHQYRISVIEKHLGIVPKVN